MKTILALRGAGNLGKSTSLGMLIAMIKAEFPGAIIDEKKFKVDITIVITINGVKVGIETQGDPNSRLGASLKRFVEIGCKVIICASRSYGQTVELINAAANSGYQVQWFAKTRTESIHSRAAANSAMATEIFNALRKAVAA